MANSTVLLMPEDAAAELGIAIQTLAKWRHQHKGPPFVRIGRNIRYRPAAIVAWIEAQEVDPTVALPPLRPKPPQGPGEEAPEIEDDIVDP